jgi:hypothetical protein
MHQQQGEDRASASAKDSGLGKTKQGRQNSTSLYREPINPTSLFPTSGSPPIYTLACLHPGSFVFWAVLGLLLRSSESLNRGVMQFVVISNRWPDFH